MTLKFSVQHFDFFSRKTRTRFPFRYGIASMTEVPHLFVQVRILVGDRESTGLAAEGLPPKWFTKDPSTTFEQDLPLMLGVIGRAAGVARQIAQRPVSFYAFWRELYREQEAWAAGAHIPPLLANLGVSLVERAILDALCRVDNQPLHILVRENSLGLRLGEIHSQLGCAEPRDLLPRQPLPSLIVRHTVGLADFLTREEIPLTERVDDGLPQDLESCIRVYGLRAFKIKLAGKIEHDLARLTALNELLKREVAGEFIVTLDGNESFENFETFHQFWHKVLQNDALSGFRAQVLAIEQPLHRQHALDPAAGQVLKKWQDHPPLIIDESDGSLGDLPRALDLGYAGTSHKNCKGIAKGIANACLLEHLRQAGKDAMLTAEDLCNLGPVALLQDLALVSLLGIPHVERNGHHYFRGLSMWPKAWQQSVQTAHSDMYENHERGFAFLRIKEGCLAVDSVNQAPFGLKPLLDPSAFERMEL